MVKTQGDVLKRKFERGCSKKTSEFRPSLYLEKCDFMTHHYTKNWVLLGANFPKCTKFCKFGTLGLEQKPIDIPKMNKQTNKKITPKPLSIPIYHQLISAPRGLKGNTRLMRVVFKVIDSGVKGPWSDSQ